MTDSSRAAPALAAVVERCRQARRDGARGFFETHAERLARLCHLMAVRFLRGGRLLALASAPGARSDARHVAVEFVHPVIVGKRALPALGLLGDAEELAAQVSALAGRHDIVLAFGAGEDGGAAARGLAAARARGCLTVAFAPAGAEWEFDPPSDRDIAQELVETLYHVLWELVHVFFEHRGLLEDGPPPAAAPAGHDPGASSFLYPFLTASERGLSAVIDDVRRSVLMKAAEVAQLREQTLTDNAGVLTAAALRMRRRLHEGATVFVLGNGGSATDAQDLVADLRCASAPEPSWPAIDLAEDPAVLTAIANDVGPELIFARQVIAYGRPRDILVAFSTSGGSANVLAALAEARRRELLTIAFVGYDGGRIAAEGLADHVVVTRSEHIPRIQEAQASAYHTLRQCLT